MESWETQAVDGTVPSYKRGRGVVPDQGIVFNQQRHEEAFIENSIGKVDCDFDIVWLPGQDFFPVVNGLAPR